MSSLFANLPYIHEENMKQTLRMRNILCPVFLDLIIPHKSVCNSRTSSVDMLYFSAKSDAINLAKWAGQNSVGPWYTVCVKN